MIEFTKNDGQYEQSLAWVAQVPPGMKQGYRGAGIARLTPDMTALDYLGEEALNPAAELDENAPIQLPLAQCEALSKGMCAMVSCWELCVEHGTAAAAYLNATGGVL